MHDVQDEDNINKKKFKISKYGDENEINKIMETDSLKSFDA